MSNFQYWRHVHNMRYELNKAREKFVVKMAFCMPRSIAYWCAIRVGAHATQGEWSNQVVPDLTLMDALKRWRNE